MKSWNGRVKSVTRSCARSTCASPRTSRRVRSPGSSEGEEDGLTISPLEQDVEGVGARAVGLGDERRALGLPEAREQGVGGVGLGLVAEVQARRDAVQQAAREDGDGEVRRLAAGCLRLAGDDLPAAVLVGRAAPEA